MAFILVRVTDGISLSARLQRSSDAALDVRLRPPPDQLRAPSPPVVQLSPPSSELQQRLQARLRPPAVPFQVRAANQQLRPPPDVLVPLRPAYAHIRPGGALPTLPEVASRVLPPSPVHPPAPPPPAQTPTLVDEVGREGRVSR